MPRGDRASPEDCALTGDTGRGLYLLPVIILEVGFRRRYSLFFGFVSLECLHLGDVFAVNQRTITILERRLRCRVSIRGLCGSGAIGFNDIFARDGTAVRHPRVLLATPIWLPRCPIFWSWGYARRAVIFARCPHQ